MSDSSFSNKWRQSRACARCRRLKVKCSFKDVSHNSCVRCFESNIQCSFDEDPTAKFARKKPRRNKAVKSEIQILSEKLLKLVESAPFEEYQTLNNLKEVLYKLEPPIQPQKYPEIPFDQNLIKQLIYNFNFLSLDEAKKRFQIFINDIYPYYPCVILSNRLKQFDFLFDEHPLLLVSFILVTAINNNYQTSINNHNLYNVLNHYLYSFLAHRVYVRCTDFNVELIYVCLILSLWCLPPVKKGQYRNQINSLTALNIALCIGLNDIKKVNSDLLDDDNETRNRLRAFFSVYCGCGGLELSLRRFKVVSWSNAHEIGYDILRKYPEDNFICLLSKVVSIGQETLNFLENYKGDVVLSSLSYMMSNYENELTKILQFYAKDQQPEAVIFKIHYDHTLIIIYDNLISLYLNSLEIKNDELVLNSNDRTLCLQMIIKLMTSCENLVDEFVKLSKIMSNYFPSMLYYKPLHGLILLVRLRLVLKSQNFKDLTCDLEYHFNKIKSVVDDNLTNSVVCQQMQILINKIEKWMKFSDTFTSRNNSEAVKMILMNKDQEIENLEAPKEEHDLESIESMSLEKIFQEIDSDILVYLNPLESNIEYNI